MDFAEPAEPRIRLMLAALLPMLATALTLTPELFRTPEEGSPVVLGLLGFSGPSAALIVNWFRPAATNKNRAAWAALPQVFIVPVMVWLNVWVDVQSGYLLRNSSEESMAYGAGITFGVIVGLVLLWLVGFAGRVGAWLGSR